MTQKISEGKLQWVDDNGFVYFVGVPEDSSATELKTLYYVDPDGKVWELPKPWGKLLASIVKPTLVPTLKPLPTEIKLPTATPKATDTPKPPVIENKPIVEADKVIRPDFVPRTASYLGNKLWSDQLLTEDCRKGKENDPRFQLDSHFVYSFDAPDGSGYAPGLYYTCQYSDQKLVKITIWKVTN
ncbi:MAG: hypothetical protein AAB550_01600 [Patescibacteria group bacterium]